jgi:hypothetical protein
VDAVTVPGNRHVARQTPAPKVKEADDRARSAQADQPGAVSEHGHVVSTVAVEVTGPT